MVNWVESAGDLDSLETSLIVKYLPLLNLSKIQLRFKFCRICEKNVSKSRIEIRNWRYNLIALGNIPMLRVFRIFVSMDNGEIIITGRPTARPVWKSAWRATAYG